LATIRDVVEALSRRDGVDAVIILGNDGLPIDSRTANGTDGDLLAAFIPTIIQAADQLGQNSARGALTTGVLEYADGFAVVATLSTEAKLLILLRPHANLGPLLYDLARFRPEIAGLL